MPYTIEILRSAQKQLSKIEPQDQRRIIKAIDNLAEDPLPPGSKKLSSRPAWRIRVGSYRVIYEIQDNRFLVVVIDYWSQKRNILKTEGVRASLLTNKATGCKVLDSREKETI